MDFHGCCATEQLVKGQHGDADLWSVAILLGACFRNC